MEVAAGLQVAQTRGGLDGCGHQGLDPVAMEHATAGGLNAREGLRRAHGHDEQLLVRLQSRQQGHSDSVTHQPPAR